MVEDLSDSLILVTGYTGFLGSHLIEALLRKGAIVVGLQLRSGNSSTLLSNLKKHPNFFCLKIGESPGKFLAENNTPKGVTACYHFAGNASAAECQKNPSIAYRSNVELTLQILEYCRLAGIRKFIYPSTGYVYGNHLKQPADETNRLISTNIYTATKIAAEALVESYAYAHGFDCSIGRLSNVYGEKSSAETVTGIIIKNILQGEPIVLKTLKPIRDFIFIDDVIRGFLTFLETKKDRTCSYYNISTGIETSIQTLVEIACETANLSKENIITKNEDRFLETKIILNPNKLRREFNWEPKNSVRDGLEKILNGK